MKNLKTIENNIAKTLKLSTVENYGISETGIFIENANRYIKAIKQGRVLCNIESVAASGMSRNLKFMECSGTAKKGFNYLNFYSLFKTLGFSNARNSNAFRVSGCGMDMVFHTNYTIINNLYHIGFINKKECSILAQRTPTTI